MIELTWHELLDALPNGCPVCLVVGCNTERAVENLLHEHVTDPGTRRRLRLSVGFCNRHAWQVQTHGDVLGQTVIYEDLLASVDAELARGRRPAPRRACLLCEEEARLERDCIGALVERFRTPDFQQRYRDSPGICLPHLAMALGAARDAALRAELAEAKRERLAVVLQDLAEARRRQDYRFCREPEGRERGAWLRAIEKLCGRPGTRSLAVRGRPGREARELQGAARQERRGTARPLPGLRRADGPGPVFLLRLRIPLRRVRAAAAKAAEHRRSDCGGRDPAGRRGCCADVASCRAVRGKGAGRGIGLAEAVTAHGGPARTAAGLPAECRRPARPRGAAPATPVREQRDARQRRSGGRMGRGAPRCYPPDGACACRLCRLRGAARSRAFPGGAAGQGRRAA